MKSTKMFLLSAIVGTVGLSCVAQKAEDECIEKLGYAFHNQASLCAKALPAKERSDRLSDLILAGEDYTLSQQIEALHFKIDGKDAITVAALAKCKLCDDYVKELELYSRGLNFMVNELGVGGLTVKEVMDNDRLKTKAHELLNKSK